MALKKLVKNGMFHSCTPDYNKDATLKSLESEDGTVRIVFATVAFGMGLNVAGLNKLFIMVPQL